MPMKEMRLSLHAQIYADIAEKIKSGQYRVGDLLPSEFDMEQMFRASRTPIRHALRQLEMDGYIYRLQGKGSYVSNNNPEGNWSLTTGFQHAYAADRERISATIVEIGKSPHPEYNALLRVDPSVELDQVIRMRYLDKDPVLYLHHYLHPVVSLSAFTADRNFFSKDEVMGKLNIRIIDIEERIEAVAALPEIAEKLQIDVGQPLLKIRRLSMALAMGPVDVTEYYVRTDIWNYIAQYRTTKN